MILQRHLTFVLRVALALTISAGSTKGERWSRQISNSEWIPLANARAASNSESGVVSGSNEAPISSLSLPPALQNQYKHQLLQLQKTQDSIQQLLLLQQQLRAQQQLLQGQAFRQDGFVNNVPNGATLPQNQLINLPTSGNLAQDTPVPQPLTNQPQPLEFAAQDFLTPNEQRSQNHERASVQDASSFQETQNDRGEAPGSEVPDLVNFSGRSEKTVNYAAGQRDELNQGKQFGENRNNVVQTTPGSSDVQNDGEEEVQLLYVPAETLAQRDQQKIQKGRNRKQFARQQIGQQQQLQQRQVQQNVPLGNQAPERVRPTYAQQAFAQQVLLQLQRAQIEKDLKQKEERERELERLRNEQKELDRQAKIHEELVLKQKELQRQKELEARRELEQQQELARQQELQRIRDEEQRKLEEEEAARRREVERVEALMREEESRREEEEKRRAEVARQAEIKRLAALEKRKELEIQQALRQQEELKRQQAEDEASARAQIEAQRLSQALPELSSEVRNEHLQPQQLPLQRALQDEQQLTETTRSRGERTKKRSRQRNQQTKTAPTPSPNQPPLAVYMGSIDPVKKPNDLKVSDVLSLLKDAKTISVLDSVGPETPQVFVGPSNLDPPYGYAKFDLPYLSAIDNNRVERKVDKLPFFVAPLSFKPPPGYSKIPFPAPHIGSVVVNTLGDGLGEVTGIPNDYNPHPTPVIQPNAYGDLPLVSTVNPFGLTPNDDSSSTGNFPSTTTAQYDEQSLPSTTAAPATRYRHRQFYNRPEISSSPNYEVAYSSTVASETSRPRLNQYYETGQVQTTPTYHSTTQAPYNQNYQENFAVESPQYSDASLLSDSPQRSNEQHQLNGPQYTHTPQHASNDPQYSNGQQQLNTAQFSSSQQQLNSPQYTEVQQQQQSISPQYSNAQQFLNSPQYSNTQQHSNIPQQNVPRPPNGDPQFVTEIAPIRLSQKSEVVHRFTNRGHAQGVIDQQLDANPLRPGPLDQRDSANFNRDVYSPQTQNWTGERVEQHPSNFDTSVNRENQFVTEAVDFATVAPTHYNLPVELPRISPQLPSLVNSLVDNRENKYPETASQTPATTTTTTTETPSTTYRTRGRQRGRLTATRTTTQPTTTTDVSQTRSTVAERTRRPYSRTRSRQSYTTTTEQASDVAYDPTKSKFAQSTVKPQPTTTTPRSHRRPVVRGQRYRGRGGDKKAIPSEAPAVVTQAPVNQISKIGDTRNSNIRSQGYYQGTRALAANVPAYQEEVLPLTTSRPNVDINLQSSAQPLQGSFPATQGLVSEPGNQHFNQIQGIQYNADFQGSSFPQLNVGRSPVDGLNYQSQDQQQRISNAAELERNFPQQQQQEQQQQQQEQQQQQQQQLQQPQNQFWNPQEQDSVHRTYNFQNGPTGPSSIQDGSHNQNAQDPGQLNNYNSPAFISQDHFVNPTAPEIVQPQYHHVQNPDAQLAFNQPTEPENIPAIPSTTTETPETTTVRATISPAPVIIRQRLRADLTGQRAHVDAAVQTRPTGSGDEFVRFSAVNQEGRNHSPARTRQRPRLRGPASRSQVQTDGNDYVRIQQTPVHRSTTGTTTTTTTTTARAEISSDEADQDVEYGFIRPPSFKPIHPIASSPIADIAVTYRPKQQQLHPEESADDSAPATDTSHGQTLKNRQLYHVANRRPLIKPTTTPEPLTTTFKAQDDATHTPRPRAQNEEWKANRIRGRVRRPGRRRTTTSTTTTDPIQDTSNEVTADNNYPRINIHVPHPTNGPKTLFDEELKSSNLEALPQAEAQQRPLQLHDFQPQETLPRQDFVLNFGYGSENAQTHEEYDQTQLASSPPHRYSHGENIQTHRAPTAGEIEGAESQWSTKLTHASFQPSYLHNHHHPDPKGNERQDKSDDTLEIITAGPDLGSMNVVVNNNGDKKSNDTDLPRNIVVNASYLGNVKTGQSGMKKTRKISSIQDRSTTEDKTEPNKADEDDFGWFQQTNPTKVGYSFGGQATNFETTVEAKTVTHDYSSSTPNRSDLENVSGSTTPISPNIDVDRAFDTEVSSTVDSVQTTLATQTTEQVTELMPKRRVNRRRRVRVRVRPADDFVTAESQYIGASYNSLTRDKFIYGKPSFFDSYKTSTTPETKSRVPQETTVQTSQASPTISETTITTSEAPSTTQTVTSQSILEDFLDEVFKTNVDTVDIPTSNTPDEPGTTTELPRDNTEDTTTPMLSTTEIDSVAEADSTTTTTTNEPQTTLTDPRNAHEKYATTEIITGETSPTEKQFGNHRYHPTHRNSWWYPRATSTNNPKSEREENITTPKSSANASEPTTEIATTTTTTIIDDDVASTTQSHTDYSQHFASMFSHSDSEATEIQEQNSSTVNADVSTLQSTTEGSETESVTDETRTTVAADVKEATGEYIDSVAEESNVEATDSQSFLRVENEPAEESSDDSRVITEQVQEALELQTTQQVPSSPVEPTTEAATTTSSRHNPITNQLGRVLRTSTTTKVSHMTEICYRGHCIKTKPRKDER